MKFEKLILLLALAFGFLGLASRGFADRKPAGPTMPRQGSPERSLYQRETGSTGGHTVRIAFTGDVMLGRGVSSERDVFSGVAAELAGADLAVGNLEGVPAEPGQDPMALSQSAQSGYRLDWPARMAGELQAAGFDLLSIANNHAGDRGEEGSNASIRALQRVGIAPLGGRPGEIVYRTVNGVRLAFLAANDVAGPGRPSEIGDGEAIDAAVSRARRQADVVIVLVHWGREYQTRSEPRQAELARRWAAAGSDLVIGSHPHVVQETQVMRGTEGRNTFVAYSLGNFVFDQGDEETRQGAVLWAEMDRDGVQSIQAQPVFTYLRPHWSGDDDKVVARMTPQGKRLSYTCGLETCEAVDATETAASGEFFQGKIDLTGDGQPERVLNAEGRVTIFQNEQPVWQSPEEWKIYDVSLGDPNDDGRFEAVIAFEKVDTRGRKVGQVASHPFLIGYRGGRYVEVWGGSAVDQPIQEIEVGDVDGDGRDDLVALERGCAGEAACEWAAVTVWRWNGWGFSLFWRGPEGRLSNLSLCRGESGQIRVCVDEEW